MNKINCDNCHRNIHKDQLYSHICTPDVICYKCDSRHLLNNVTDVTLLSCSIDNNLDCRYKYSSGKKKQVPVVIYVL